MLKKEELLDLGYEINEDQDRPGEFFWKTTNDVSAMSFDSEEVAVFSASNHALRVHDDLHRCDNCGKVHVNEMLKIAKHLGERVEPGGFMPSGECRECGALCYPIEPDPDWETVMSYFGLDSSFMYTAKQAMDYTRQYVESMAEADRKERMGEAAIAALARIKAHPNCRHEVEAQLGDEVWTALQGIDGKQVGDASQKVMKLLEEADSYLREIRAENLDGSEPELGELLEQLTGFWIDAGLIKTVVQVERESDSKRDVAILEAEAGDMQVSLDGGATYQPAVDGVRIIYKDMPISDGYEDGELHVNATYEGLILDVWATREGLVLNENIGTSAQMATDIVARMIEAND